MISYRKDPMAAVAKSQLHYHVHCINILEPKENKRIRSMNSYGEMMFWLLWFWTYKSKERKGKEERHYSYKLSDKGFFSISVMTLWEDLNPITTQIEEQVEVIKKCLQYLTRWLTVITYLKINLRVEVG